MNSNEIPAYMKNIIAARMLELVKGGMDNADALEYAVRLANQDIQSICQQMLAGNFQYNADEIRGAIAADAYRSLQAAA